MIAELTLHNFKCFIDQSITVGPLTLLVGANASGKSSVLQSLLLLRQSHLRGALSEGKLVLNGRLSNVGTMRDAVSRDLVDEELIFDLGTNNGERNVFRFEYVRGETDVYVMSGPLPQYDKQLNIFQTAFNYLNAERIGPRLTYPMQEDERWSYDVGIHGEYTAQILNRAKNDPVTLTIDDPDTNTQIPEQERTVGRLTQSWMRQVIPHFEYDTTALNQADQVQILFSNRGPNDLFRPTNIGFGLIYTLPIVVAALVAPPGSMLIVENPEAHLHPASQSAIGRFLAQVAAAGVQVIVETHSDHVLNGIRLAVRKKDLAAEHVSIQYFVSADRETAQQVITPRLYPSGGISPRPDGFFDQIDKDITELL